MVLANSVAKEKSLERIGFMLNIRLTLRVVLQLSLFILVSRTKHLFSKLTQYERLFFRLCNNYFYAK
jgi:hypothetical protein